jgi:DNA polymerase
MYAVRLPVDADEAKFREEARKCLSLGLTPRDVAFVTEAEPSLFPEPQGGDTTLRVKVPRHFSELLADSSCHSAPDRFALLYEILWRILHGESRLSTNLADPAVAQLNDYARSVRRDIHKMHAFVRFRAREMEGRTIYIAWFEPQHFILRRAAEFFVDRFASMDWIIATPIGTAIWRDRELVFAPPRSRQQGEQDPVLDEVWQVYFRTTFNPARLRLKAMRAEMPERYWKNMPETALIPSLVAEASRRVVDMDGKDPDDQPRYAKSIAIRMAEEKLRVQTTPGDLPAEIAACRRCHLHAAATQAVFGEGPSDAELAFVGEQPGDQEDLTGRPFVGPAGALLDQAFAEAGIDRAQVYLTNAVKHFKYTPRGKRRIHQKPNQGEVSACRWWLESELSALSPKLVVALGGTAATALAGRPIAVTRARGPMQFGPLAGFVTVHPSYLLRLPDPHRRQQEYDSFVADLRCIKSIADARTRRMRKVG